MIATTTRDELHRLVDMLPSNTLGDARSALRRFAETDPFIRSLLNAPVDHEPETPEEAAAIAKAWEDVRAGRVVSHEEVKRRLLGDP